MTSEPEFTAYIAGSNCAPSHSPKDLNATLTGSDLPRIVIFDLGEVLVTPSGMIEALSERIGHDPKALEWGYWSRRLDYDLGLDAAVYWTEILRSLGVRVTSAAIEDLVRIDTQGWTTIRADASRMLEQLHAAGVRIAILSNATMEMCCGARGQEWAQWVADWFFSAELGVAKPDPAIFAHVTEALGLPAESIVYIDDSRQSIDSARAAGWKVHLWTSGAEAEGYLSALGLFSSRPL